jgi:hypothetical protein
MNMNFKLIMMIMWKQYKETTVLNCLFYINKIFEYKFYNIMWLEDHYRIQFFISLISCQLINIQFKMIIILCFKFIMGLD